MASDELLTFSTQCEGRTSKLRLGKLAARQFGRVSRAQLMALNVPRSTIDRWRTTGYLIRVLPGIYAVGHRTADEGARLFELVLFAGPDAALSRGTSAHWRGWLRYPVKAIHIGTPRRIRTPLPSVVFHYKPDLTRELVSGIPCTTATQTLLDLAATEDPKLVRRSLAQLDYERKLSRQAICAACGRGKPGSAALLSALNSYIPQLSYTKSALEDEYLYLCQRFKIPLPQVNASVHGEEPDCYWPELGLVVELDGGGNHSSAPQRHRDQRKALKLRSHGLAVLRYTNDQVFNTPERVARDTLAQIAERRKLGSRLKYPA